MICSVLPTPIFFYFNLYLHCLNFYTSYILVLFCLFNQFENKINFTTSWGPLTKINVKHITLHKIFQVKYLKKKGILDMNQLYHISNIVLINVFQTKMFHVSLPRSQIHLLESLLLNQNDSQNILLQWV